LQNLAGKRGLLEVDKTEALESEAGDSVPVVTENIVPEHVGVEGLGPFHFN